MKTKIKKTIAILLICFLVSIPNLSKASIITQKVVAKQSIKISSDASKQKIDREKQDSDLIKNPTSSSSDTSQGGKKEPSQDTGIHQNPGSSIINPDDYKPGKIDSGLSESLSQKAGIIMNWIFILGVIISVITLVIIGIKYMLGSVAEKAEYKKTMIPYLVGVFLVAATSTIVKLIASIIMPLAENL